VTLLTSIDRRLKLPMLSSMATASFWRTTLEAAAVFISAAAFGFALLVGLFKAGVLGQIDIVFYRGVALCIVACVLTMITVGWLGQRLGVATVRDAFAAGCLSFGLNLSFLVIAPVTVDRSISVFMIATMAAAPDRAVTTAEMDQAFRAQYLERMTQIDRRMKEQVTSGTIALENGALENGTYRITEKGLGFMRTARLVAWLFDTDPKLLNQPPVPTAPSLQARPSATSK
jgi:hypothetical protein